MPVLFKIQVTKEILGLSRNCGQSEIEIIWSNCAIALASKDIFPNVINILGYKKVFKYSHSGNANGSVLLDLHLMCAGKMCALS